MQKPFYSMMEYGAVKDMKYFVKCFGEVHIICVTSGYATMYQNPLVSDRSEKHKSVFTLNLNCPELGPLEAFYSLR